MNGETPNNENNNSPPAEGPISLPMKNADDIQQPLPQTQEGIRTTRGLLNSFSEVQSLMETIQPVGEFADCFFRDGSFVSSLGASFIPNIIDNQINPNLLNLKDYLLDKKAIASLPYLDFCKMDPYEKRLRFIFLRKTFAVFTAQIALTCGIICLCFEERVRFSIVIYSWYLLGGFLVLFLTCLVIILVNKAVSLTCPWNYIVLFLFTISEGFVLLSISCMNFFYVGDIVGESIFKENIIGAGVAGKDIVLILMTMLGMLSFGITIFVLCNKNNFNYCGGFWFSVLFVAVGFIACGIGLRPQMSDIGGWWMTISICFGGVFLFSFYFVYDSVCLIRNLRLYYSPNDFVFAAMMLYLDVVKIIYDLLRFIADIIHIF